MAKLRILFLLVCFAFSTTTTTKSVNPIETQPQPFDHFTTQPQEVSAAVARSCAYTVTIKTSCSSSRFTRDKISLAFGDAYGNEVYAPRLDNPQSRTFERCSTDTFQITGPCTYEICYLNLLRVGSDGWKPETVKLISSDRRKATYNFNSFLPNNVWFGFNHCKSALPST